MPTDAGMAAAAGCLAAAPFKSLTTSVVLVEGPAMVKVLKSSLSYITVQCKLN